MKNTIYLVVIMIILNLFSCNNDDIFHNKNEVAPQVSYTFPKNNQTGININTSILFSFDIEMDKNSITNENISVKDDNGNLIESELEFYGASAVLCHPYTNANSNVMLESNKTYTMTIKKDIKDLQGVSMENDFLIKFKTGNYADEKSPYIVDFKLENNIIKIFYNELINPLTVEKAANDLNIILQDENSNLVKGNISYDTTSNAIVFVPDQNLKTDVMYNFIIKSNSISDLSKNYNENNFRQQIKHGKVIDTINPTVLNVTRSSNITIEFSENLDKNSLLENAEKVPLELKDINGEILEFSIIFTNESKTIILMPTVPLINYKMYYLTINPFIITDQAGNYIEDKEVIELKGEEFINETPIIKSINQSPKKVSKGDIVELVATAYDPDGDSLNFNWKIINKPEKSNTVLSITGNKVSFTADIIGVYEIECVVSDNKSEIVKTIPVSIDALKFVGSYKRQFGESGEVLETFISGNYLYAACSKAGLKIFDITDTLNPIYKGSYPSLSTQDVYVRGDYAYIADNGYGFKILDISDASSVKLISHIEPQHFSYMHRVVVSGNYAYISCWYDAICIVDISDLSSPKVVNNIDFVQTIDITIAGNYLYVIESNDLKIIDISNPLLPDIVGSVYIDSSTDCRVFLKDNYAYVADEYEGLKIIDIADVTNPQIIGSVPVKFYQDVDISVVNDYAYVTTGENGLQIIDISNKFLPWPVANFQTDGDARAIQFKNNYGYIADGNGGIKIIDITDQLNPELKVTLGTMGYAKSVFVSANFAYLAAGSDGLQVIDVSDPTSPGLVAEYNTNGFASEVFLSGNYAYVADDEQGLKIINISDPLKPTLAGSIDTDGNALGVKVSGHYAYVADKLEDLKIIDVSNPLLPTFIKEVATPSRALGVYVLGSNAYIANYLSGLSIANVSNPFEAKVIGNFYQAGYATAVNVSGNYAYVAFHHLGLNIIDISNPLKPTLSSNYKDSLANSIFVSGNYAYTCEGYSGLKVINITDKKLPVLKGTVNTENAQGIHISGDYVFVADGDSTEILKIYEIIE